MRAIILPILSMLCLSVYSQNEIATIIVDGKAYTIDEQSAKDGKIYFTSLLFEELVKRLNDLEAKASPSGPVNEIEFLRKNKSVISPEWIAARYNKNNNKKNGYSTVEIGQMLGVDVKNKSEIILATEIYSKL